MVWFYLYNTQYKVTGESRYAEFQVSSHRLQHSAVICTTNNCRRREQACKGGRYRQSPRNRESAHELDWEGVTY